MRLIVRVVLHPLRICLKGMITFNVGALLDICCLRIFPIADEYLDSWAFTGIAGVPDALKGHARGVQGLAKLRRSVAKQSRLPE
jgi:hypothetical protein